ncbi:MAG TPA: L-rhamnose mutarotase [Bacteroidales bacterium]|nr:L-rhamnose mutarotase [Bacteroidales bacterium]
MNHPPQTFASVIRLKPEYRERYIALHRNTFPGVLQRIARSGISNYTIFLSGDLLFSHMVYEGSDFAAGMKAMAADKTTRQWWLLTDPMQEPVEGRKEGEWWAALEPVMSYGEEYEPLPGALRMAFIAPAGAANPGWKDILDYVLKDPGIPLIMKIFNGYDHHFLYLAIEEKHRSVLAPLTGSAHPMEEVFHTESNGPERPKKVFVSGCFDMLHSGHVAFLQEAAGYGNVHVCIGSDETIAQLKGRYPVYPEKERKYLLDALSCVHECRINKGSGILDFLEELKEIRPDVFIVNEEGHTPAKEALCHESGIEYKVLKRLPHQGLPARSTTLLRTECTIPFRIDLAGGWLDQPYVSKHHPGPVLTISIEPTVEFNDRSGMASSTRRKAIELWHHELPHGDPGHLARVLFSFENPPGTGIIAGSQDSLGIVLPGLNYLYYEPGSYWPSRIQQVHNEDILCWIEEHLCLVTLGPRVKQYDVLAGTDINPVKAKVLANAADNCWNAILARDLAAFGDAFRRSFEAQVAMFPNMAGEDIYDAIARYRDGAAGWKLSGAGGGGYLILVTARPPEGTVRIRIRRKSNI